MTGAVMLHLPFTETLAALKSWSRFSARKSVK